MSETPDRSSSPGDGGLASKRQLTLAQLLLWITGIAVYLGIFRALMLEGRVPDPWAMKIQTEIQLQSLLLAPFIGAALGGIILWLAHLLKRSREFPVHPGHWMLLGVGFQFLAHFTVAALVEYGWLSLPAGQPAWWQLRLIGLVLSAGFLTGAVWAAAALVSCRESKAWCIYFAAVIVAQLVPVPAMLWTERAAALDALGNLSLRSHFILLHVSVLLLLAAIVSDQRHRRRRDAVHWVGIAAMLGDIVTAWIAPLMYIVLADPL